MSTCGKEMIICRPRVVYAERHIAARKGAPDAAAACGRTQPKRHDPTPHGVSAHHVQRGTKRSAYSSAVMRARCYAFLCWMLHPILVLDAAPIARVRVHARPAPKKPRNTAAALATVLKTGNATESKIRKAICKRKVQAIALQAAAKRSRALTGTRPRRTRACAKKRAAIKRHDEAFLKYMRGKIQHALSLCAHQGQLTERMRMRESLAGPHGRAPGVAAREDGKHKIRPRK